MAVGIVGRQYGHQKWYVISKGTVGIKVLLNSEGQKASGSCTDGSAGGEFVITVINAQ